MVAAITTGGALAIGVPIGAALTWLLYTAMLRAHQEARADRRREADRRFYAGDWPWRA